MPWPYLKYESYEGNKDRNTKLRMYDFVETRKQSKTNKSHVGLFLLFSSCEAACAIQVKIDWVSEKQCWVLVTCYTSHIGLEGAVNNGTVIGWGLAHGIFHHHRLVSRQPIRADAITSTTRAEHAAACDLAEEAPPLRKATFDGDTNITLNLLNVRKIT